MKVILGLAAALILVSVVLILIQNPIVANSPSPAISSPTPNEQENPTATYSPTSSVSPTAWVPDKSQDPIVTSSPSPSPSAPSYDELVSYALFLINSDRASLGSDSDLYIGAIDQFTITVPPVGSTPDPCQNVTLSPINSAQKHAEDMLKNHYFSHWNTNGDKPYMRYTLAGGDSAVAENIAWLSGSISPKEAIRKLEGMMMFDDAGSNWGHKDNILNPSHNRVSIGIAYDESSFYLVEDFEDCYINWAELSATGSSVVMNGDLPREGMEVRQIQIQFDATTALTVAELEKAPYRGSYDMGKTLGLVLPPSWESPEGITITAGTWTQTGTSFQISFDLSPAFSTYGKGIYTLLLYTSGATEPLTTFSVWNQ